MLKALDRVPQQLRTMNCATGSFGGKQEARMRALTSSLPNKPRSSRNVLFLKALGSEQASSEFSEFYDSCSRTLQSLKKRLCQAYIPSRASQEAR